MKEPADIEALEGWLRGFPAPRPGEDCRQRLKAGVRRALQDVRCGGVRLPEDARQRVKEAVRHELQRGAMASRRSRPLVGFGSGLAAAAALALMATLMSNGFPRAASGSGAEMTIAMATIYEDPDVVSLDEGLADLELWTAALEYYREPEAADDPETLRVLEALTAPDYHIDFDDSSS